METLLLDTFLSSTSNSSTRINPTPCNHSRLTPLQRLLRLISEGIVTRFPPSARYYTRGTVDPLDSWSSRSCNLAQTSSLFLQPALKLRPTFMRIVYIYILGTPDAGDRLQIARSSFILFRISTSFISPPLSIVLFNLTVNLTCSSWSCSSKLRVDFCTTRTWLYFEFSFLFFIYCLE